MDTPDGSFTTQITTGDKRVFDVEYAFYPHSEPHIVVRKVTINGVTRTEGDTEPEVWTELKEGCWEDFMLVQSDGDRTAEDLEEELEEEDDLEEDKDG